MTDLTDDIFATPPVRLARLMGASQNGNDPMFVVDLSAILRHQLEAPIQFGVEAMPETSGKADDGKPKGEDQRPPITNLRELFRHPNPPIEWLRQVKDFAKINREHSDSPMPKEIATVLYYASIAAGWVRHRQRITSLDIAALREGMTWAQSQPWVDGPTRALMTEAITVLGPAEPSRE